MVLTVGTGEGAPTPELYMVDLHDQDLTDTTDLLPKGDTLPSQQYKTAQSTYIIRRCSPKYIHKISYSSER